MTRKPEDITLRQIEHVLPLKVCITELSVNPVDHWFDFEAGDTIPEELLDMYVIMMGTFTKDEDYKSSYLCVGIHK